MQKKCIFHYPMPFDYDMIQKNAKAIFDTKNAMKNVENRENIEVL